MCKIGEEVIITGKITHIDPYKFQYRIMEINGYILAREDDVIPSPIAKIEERIKEIDCAIKEEHDEWNIDVLRNGKYQLEFALKLLKGEKIL